MNGFRCNRNCIYVRRIAVQYIQRTYPHRHALPSRSGKITIDVDSRAKVHGRPGRHLGAPQSRSVDVTSYDGNSGIDFPARGRPRFKGAQTPLGRISVSADQIRKAGTGGVCSVDFVDKGRIELTAKIAGGKLAGQISDEIESRLSHDGRIVQSSVKDVAHPGCANRAGFVTEVDDSRIDGIIQVSLSRSIARKVGDELAVNIRSRQSVCRREDLDNSLFITNIIVVQCKVEP